VSWSQRSSPPRGALAIIFHSEQGATIFPLEFFDEPQAAMSRAEEVLDGVGAPPTGNSSAFLPVGAFNRALLG